MMITFAIGVPSPTFVVIGLSHLCLKKKSLSDGLGCWCTMAGGEAEGGVYRLRATASSTVLVSNQTVFLLSLCMSVAQDIQDHRYCWS